ncbi:MAG: methyltransferase [Spirochaetales bacterium]|nr:methyltransferase [Spirochaetales bacterium]
MTFPFPPADPFSRDKSLTIYPPTTDNSLRPWDGADEYLLETVFQEYGDRLPLNAALVNDNHGALTVPLAPSASVCLNDSFSARKSIEQNLQDNGIEEIPSFSSFTDDFEAEVDLIIMKIPKALALFRYQLSRIAERINKPVTILAAGPAKLMPPSFYETFETYTERPSYSLIKKRARFYRGTLLPAQKEKSLLQQFTWDQKDFTTFPGVFSYGKADKGSLFLLDRFPRVSEPPVTIVDPGCGCGILGIQAALTWPDAQIIATDDSALALESTRLSAAQNGVIDRFDIRHTNILDGVESDSADLVICNPPFHSQHRVQLERGFAFIDESARVLKTGGQLFLVANRYLGYEKRLKESFNKMTILGQDRKFRLYMGTK